jgi:hypothetical protein
MRRFLVLLTLVLVALAVVYRDRLYLRDPLGKMARDGVEQEDARVFINYENDVLVREKGGSEMFVVQHWNGQPATPGGLTCVEGMLCVTPADRVVDVGEVASTRAAAQMTDRAVSFTDATGAKVLVTIR